MTAGVHRLGRYFTLPECTITETGLANVPDLPAIVCMTALVATVLDPLRRYLGRPVHVTSMYRSPEVNRAVGGSSTSDHLTGEAADIRVDGMGSVPLGDYLMGLGLDVDQVIVYPGLEHVHVSHRLLEDQRGQTLQKVGGQYLPWSPRERL